MKLTLAILSYVTLFPNLALAYFDPGITPLLYQIGYGILSAGVFVIFAGPKKILAYIKSMFSKKNSTENSKEDK
jgi:hypothetical protein